MTQQSPHIRAAFLFLVVAFIVGAFVFPFRQNQLFEVEAFGGQKVELLQKNDATNLEKNALQVLDTYCAACHSEKGKDSKKMEREFLSADDANRMRQERWIRVDKNNKPGDSPIFQRISSGSMPDILDGETQPKKLSADEKGIIKQWLQSQIDAQQPKPGPTLGLNQTSLNEYILGQIQQDTISSAKDDPLAIRFYRYFTTTHIPSAEQDNKSKRPVRDVLEDGLIKLVNSLSWRHAVKRPQPIDDHRSIFRIDIRDYDWSSSTWESVAKAYPYRIKFGERWSGVYKNLETDIPFFRADWFVAEASREPLYSQILRLPPTDLLLEQLFLKTDVLVNLADGVAARSGFIGSKVALNDGRFRLLERHPTPYGAYWKSYDFNGVGDTKNLLNNPFGPKNLAAFYAADARRADDVRRAFAASKKLFEHAGGELIFNLPNGLQAYMLVDANGNSIKEAPTNVVTDSIPNRLRGTVIENGFSCIRCHDQGMKDPPVIDEVRAHIGQNDGTKFNRVEVNLARAHYPDAKHMSVFFATDRKRFVAAVENLGLKLGHEPIAAAADRYDQNLDLLRLAAELGLQGNELSDAIKRSQPLAKLLPIAAVFSRKEYEKNFPAVIAEIKNTLPQSELANAEFLITK